MDSSALDAASSSKQEQRVFRLRRKGHNATEAQSLLETFRSTHAQQVAHRDLLLMELVE